MRKIVFCLMATFLSVAFIPVHASATNDPVKTSTAPAPLSPVEAAKVITLESRLKEIDAMEKSDLDKSEKKELRKEVKSIKHELNAIGDGVYISAGALILILILVILL
jgi:hypothetical protein